MAKLFELPRYIAVEGPIRVGKSTLARVLAERLAAQRVIEPEDNPFLGAFYDGDRGAAFQAQMTFLIRRFEQLRALEQNAGSDVVAAVDLATKNDAVDGPRRDAGRARRGPPTPGRRRRAARCRAGRAARRAAGTRRRR